MSSKENSPALQTLFKRVPSLRDRTRRRASLGQVSGAVALHDAVAKGKLHLAKFILDAVGGQLLVDVRDAHGKTPLIRAMRISDYNTRTKAVDLLISYNANVNLLDNVGRSALSYACELGCNDIIKKLVQNNVDPNLEDNNGNTPLMYCAMVNNSLAIEIISRSFRRLGLEVDKVNAEGMTPLMEAAKNGFLECARLLAREAKASVIARDVVRNMNAADWAREGGCSTPDVEVLLPKQRAPVRTTHSTAKPYGLIAQRKNRNPAKDFKLESQSPSLQDNALSHDPNSFAFSASGLGIPSGKRHESCIPHPASMEELSCRFKELKSQDRSHDTANSYPDMLSVGRHLPQIDGNHQLMLQSHSKGDPRSTSKPGASARGGLFIKRPQPPALPRRPCSAAVTRQAKNVNGARTSNSMEDLLLMSDHKGGIPLNTPSSPKSLKSSSMSHLVGLTSDTCDMSSPRFEEPCRSVNSETHIDLKIIPSQLSKRHRTSSHPLPFSEPTRTDQLASVSCTHLPPISPKHGL